jgi:hypothetical protein
VTDDEEHVEGAERDGGHREEVHGGDAGPVVPEERRPGLPASRGARQGAQVAGDAALGDLEAEAEQLSVDAGRTPEVLGSHPPDERSDPEGERRAARARAAPGQPVPVDAEPGSVPAHDRVRPDDGETLGPTAPEVPQQDPEDPVGGPDDRTPSRDQRGELLSEGQILDHQVAACAHGRAERRQEGHEEAEHRAGRFQAQGGIVNVPGPDGLLASHSRRGGTRRDSGRDRAPPRCVRMTLGPARRPA